MSDLLEEKNIEKIIISSNEIRVTINLPRENVFEFTMEPNNKALWCKNITEESADTEQIGQGTKYTNNFGVLEVTDYERNVYLELTEEGTEYQCSYSYRKIDEKNTELIYFEGMLDGSELLEPTEVESFEKLKEILESYDGE